MKKKDKLKITNNFRYRGRKTKNGGKIIQESADPANIDIRNKKNIGLYI